MLGTKKKKKKKKKHDKTKVLLSQHNEYIDLENSGNDKGDDQNGNTFMLSIPLKLPPLILSHYSIYNNKGNFELNQRRCVPAHSQNSIPQELIWLLS